MISVLLRWRAFISHASTPKPYIFDEKILALSFYFRDIIPKLVSNTSWIWTTLTLSLTKGSVVPISFLNRYDVSQVQLRSVEMILLDLIFLSCQWTSVLCGWRVYPTLLLINEMQAINLKVLILLRNLGKRICSLGLRQNQVLTLTNQKIEVQLKISRIYSKLMNLKYPWLKKKKKAIPWDIFLAKVMKIDILFNLPGTDSRPRFQLTMR